MGFRGRGNQRARRPFRARGRGRRPFSYRGKSRGGFGVGDEGLRITLRNTDRGRRSGEHEGYGYSSDRDRRDGFDSDYMDEFDNSGHGFEEGGMFEDDSSHRDSPRKRQRADSDSPHTSTWDEGRGGKDRWEDDRQDRWDSERQDRWEEEQQKEDYRDRRRSREDYGEPEGSYDNDRRDWPKKKRGRGRGRFRPRGFDPNYRGRGRGRGDFRGGFRGRGRGEFEPHETRGRGFYKHFERGRGRGGFSPHDRHSFDSDFDSFRRDSLTPERRRSRSLDRFSRSPGRRRSRSFGRSRSRSPSYRRNYSRERSFSRSRSRSRGRRSLSRGRSRSRGRRSRSQGKRSVSRRRPSLSRGRRSRSRRRSHSRGRRRSRSFSGSRSYSGSRRSSSRSRTRSPVPVRREASQPKSMGREIDVLVSGRDRSMPRSSPPRSSSFHRSLSQSRRRSRSSSSSSSHAGGGTSQDSALMSEQQYEEEMFRRLKSEINSMKDPREREEGIALHIREMAKLSPVLFRQFMAKNAGSLSAMALMQPEEQEHRGVELLSSQEEDSRPLRSILKRKGDSRSPSPTRNPSPPPPEQPKALTQIEKVIQALRKGGSKLEEPKPEKEETPPPPLASGALRQLSSYMDIDDEEEYLYGEGGAGDTKPEEVSGPFWSAHRFEEKHHMDTFDSYGPGEPYSSGGSAAAAPPKGNEMKFPSAFSSLEEKERSYEQWRASVFQKSAPEEPKEPDVPQPAPAASDSSEQLSSTVENILKSIGFNFELSQRMQELARQKKEEEQDALKINQSASFLGAHPDALAQSLGGAFQKEEQPPPGPIGFMKEIEAAKQAAREKAQRVKEAEERRREARNPSFEKDYHKERTRRFSSNYEDSICAKEEDSRKVSDAARTHSPYDPSVPDYRNRRSLPPEQDRKDASVHRESSAYFEGAHRSHPSGLSNLISGIGNEGRGLPDFDRHDRDEEDVEYKKAGERILIVRKKESSDRTDSPGSENSFSRRIVLPPKEKAKAAPVRSPSSDSRKEGKKRLATPDSPKQSKYPRRSPSLEGSTSGRRVFQKSKDSTKPEEVKGDKKTQERSFSPARYSSDSKFKYQAKQGGGDFKVKPQHLKALEESSSVSYPLKTKEKEVKPEPVSEDGLKQEVKAATKKAESKAQMMERKRQLLVLQRELQILQQQHNELLRKRRRQKDSHKDPLIAENSKLQKEIAAQIKSLRVGDDSEASAPVASSASQDKSSKSEDEVESKAKEEPQKSQAKAEPKIHYEYFDPGSHWCSTCNIVCGHMFDFFTHVETKKHQQKLDPFNRPWLEDAMQKQEKKPKPQGQVQAAPIKGLEFMMATSAFYCSLCNEFCGDLSIAEAHMKSEEHHNKYKEYLSQHPYYEKRYMLERSAALVSQKRSSIGEEEDSHDSDNEKEKSDEAQKKAAPKSDSKSKVKDKDGNWKEKILTKKMYADYEEESKVKFETRDRDQRKYRRRSRDRSRERSRERRGSRERRSSRERRGDARDRKDSKDGKGNKSSKEKPEKSGSSKPAEKEAAPEGKATESSETGDKTVEPGGSETEQNAGEEGTKEDTDKDLNISMESEVSGKDDDVDEGVEVDEKDKETESKGKIPIKLTGKSGIKPAAPVVPPWKMFTRPIPRPTQKRLLAPRPQPVATSSGSATSKEPASLDDFLTVGVKKTVPVVSDAAPQDVEQPPDPKTYRKTGDSKVGKDRERLEEMKTLGIDPSTLVPSVKPKTPPPPSQNLSLPVPGTSLAVSSASVPQPSAGPGIALLAVPTADFSQPPVSSDTLSFCPSPPVHASSPLVTGPQYGPSGPTMMPISSAASSQPGFGPPSSSFGPPGSGPPGSNFGPPGSSFGPSGPPGSNFGPPGSGPPGSNFGPPGSNFGPNGPPGSNFGPPGSNFGPNGPPGSNFGPPGSGPPGSNFGPNGPPGSNFGPPGSNFGPPGSGFGPSGPPRSRFGPLGSNFGPSGPPGSRFGPPGSCPGPGFGPPGPGFGPPGPGFGPPCSNYGPPGSNFGGPPVSGFGPTVSSFGPGFGPLPYIPPAAGPAMGPPTSMAPPSSMASAPKAVPPPGPSAPPPPPPSPPPPLPNDPAPVPPPPPSPPKPEGVSDGDDGAGQKTEKSPKTGDGQPQGSSSAEATPAPTSPKPGDLQAQESSTSEATPAPTSPKPGDLQAQESSTSEATPAPTSPKPGDLQAQESSTSEGTPALQTEESTMSQGVVMVATTSQAVEVAPSLQAASESQACPPPVAQESEMMPTGETLTISQVAEASLASPAPEVLPSTSQSSDVLPTLQGTEEVPIPQGTEGTPTSQTTLPPASQELDLSASEGMEVPPPSQAASPPRVQQGTELYATSQGVEVPPALNVHPTAQDTSVPLASQSSEMQGMSAGTLPPTLYGTAEPPTSQEAEVLPAWQGTEAPSTSQGAEVPPVLPVEGAPQVMSVAAPAIATVHFPAASQTSSIVESSIPLVQLYASASSVAEKERTADVPPNSTATASGTLPSEIPETCPYSDIQSNVAGAWAVPSSAVVSSGNTAVLVSTSSAASCVPPPASSECSLEAEPQPSAGVSESAPSGQFAEPTSSLVSVSTLKSAARRGRGGRKAVAVRSALEEESDMPESDASPATTTASRRSRARARGQPRQQPQRQTRSRTRQQRCEEEEENVTASDEATVAYEGEVGSSTPREVESPDGTNASSTSACVLDLTSPPADSSGGAEANTEVTSSSSDVKTVTVVEPPSSDSALNLTIPPEIRGARQELREQTMPEDLSSYAQPQDLSTSAGKRRGRHPPEMPIDLTKRLVPTQSQQPEASEPMEIQPSPSCPSSSSEGGSRQASLDPQTMKDTLLSSTSALNPSASNLPDLEVGDEGDPMEASAGPGPDSVGLGVDPEGDLVDFSLAPVNFEELEDMEVDEANAAPSEAGQAEDSGGAADSSFPQD